MKTPTLRTLVAAMLSLSQAPLLGQVPTILSQPASQTLWAGGNVTFGVTVSGGGPFAYQWQLNGTNLPNNIITTVAGGGFGDGGQATNASLDFPYGVAVDANGNLFIADLYNNRILEVSTNGLIARVAGNGGRGYSGDGGPATHASLSDPSGVAVDANGYLFIADSGRIRRVSTNGIITTVAGGGTDSPGDGGAATNAALASYGVAVDANGNLFIADSGRIRRVGTNGIITTVAGNGTNGYSGDGGPATNATLAPYGVAVDANRNLFIADAGNHRIRKVSTDGTITTVAGNGVNAYSGDGGPATNASLGSAEHVAVDATGNLYIPDFDSNRIREVSAGGVITTVAGNGISGYFGDGGAATNAELNPPHDVAVDASGNLFIADSYNNRIRKVDSNGIISTVAGNGTAAYSGDGGPATKAALDTPSGVAVDGSGNLFIADYGNNRIRKVSTNGIISTAAGDGANGYSGDGGAATNAGLGNGYYFGPSGMAAAPAGNLFIADRENNRIRKVNQDGIITTVAGNGTKGFSGDGAPATNASLSQPSGVAVDASGNLFIADTGGYRIRKVNSSGIITTVAGNGTNLLFGHDGDGGAATNAALYPPQGVAADASGNLFIADSYEGDSWDFGRIHRVGADGIITTVAGGGTNSLGNLGGVAVDTSGNLFISDSFSIRKVNTNGIITTVAGGGTNYLGDGGAATNDHLGDPFYGGPLGVAVDSAGNLFIADIVNNRIRKVSNTEGPVLTLSNVSPGDSGNYQVVVTGAGGSVTSRVARLTIASAPLIYAATPQSDGRLAIAFLASPGSTNVVLSATNLVPPIYWQPTTTNLAGADGRWQYIDGSAPSVGGRFFRSVTLNNR